MKGLFDWFRRSEQPPEAIEAADALLDRPDRATIPDSQQLEWRQRVAATVARRLYNANPAAWCDMNEQQMTFMMTRWIAMRWLLSHDRHPEWEVIAS